MNPIEQFEQCLRQLSTSKMPSADKARKMREVNEAIERYLTRVEAIKYQEAAAPAVERAKAQLRDLAAQANELAQTYGRASNATVH